MSYHKKTIRKVIEDIESGKVYLPAIQRKFVWRKEQIELLFDSIMRNYPIGTFLFWYLDNKKADEYVFYEFLKEYDDRDGYNKKKHGHFLKDEIIGVLDGQQRLSSMYLALQGIYREKLKYHSWNNPNAFPDRKLYLNILSLPYLEMEDYSINIEKDKDFEFRFLTEEESLVKSVNKLWFEVRKVLSWGEDPPIDEFYDSLADLPENQNISDSIRANRKFIKKAVRDLHHRLSKDELINYFKTEEKELDDILKIFVRVNSGGTILSKTDLLFSTIVATWEDGREEIERFIKQINDKGEKFNFNNDFLMRCCLVLTDCAVLFKVNSFKTSNVLKIKNEWTNIKTAISRTVDLLVEFGYNGRVLTSQNAIIVIAYYLIKGGNVDASSKNDLRKYLQHALLKNVYGGQGDQVIARFRDTLRNEVNSNGKKEYELRDRSFSFDIICTAKLPASKSMRINLEDIEEFMDFKKGANAFFVLSILYPNLKFNQINFHQDHIHPDSGFTNAKLRDAGVSEDKWQDWQWKKDRLPNLQLMEGRENESKNNKPFQEWLNENESIRDKGKFLSDNYIPNYVNLSFSNFNEFYESRKKNLTQELCKVLNIEIRHKSKQDV